MSSPATDATPAAPPAPKLVAPDVVRIEANELAELLQSDAARKPLIVDVRDPLTTGGFIKGALSIPKVQFDNDAFVDEFLDKHGKNGELLVFHCLNSNGRGPTAAGRVFDRIKDKFPAGGEAAKPEVRVLKGGFKVFSETHGLDSPLVDPSDLPAFTGLA